MTDTIRLSDRLELRACDDIDSGPPYWYLDVDGQQRCSVSQTVRDALTALANPPRYDLPNGVIAGSDGKFYAPGDVVRTLPDEMWATYYASGNKRIMRNAQDAVYSYFYEVRPTAANPLKPLPDHTFPLPDGTLACFRRDAAKLREAGATVRASSGSAHVPAFADKDLPGQVLRVEFPPTPKTERVPWWEAVGRKHQVWGPILSVSADGDGAQIETATHSLPADADGTVEVLLTDTER